MAVEKTFKFRILDKAGVYISTPAISNFTGFRKVINGGLGDLTFDLPMKFNEAYTNPLTKPGNQLEVYCIDGDTGREGILLYTGLIISRNPHFAGSNEGVTLNARGHASRFATIPLLGNSPYATVVTNVTFGVGDASTAAASTPVDLTLKGIINQYRTWSTYPMINYNATSVASAGVSFTWRFASNYILNALQSTVASGPAGCWWYAGADNVFQFSLLGTAADHILSFGSQIYAWDDTESLDGMANKMLLAYNNSAALTEYLDSASVTDYADWWKITNQNYTNSTDALNFATAQIHAANVPLRRLVITVPDNNSSNQTFKSIGYDIETFNPGQMVKITNLPIAVQQVFPGLLQIQAVNYEPGQAVLELVTLSDNLARDYAQKLALQSLAAQSSNPNTFTGPVSV